MTNILAISPKLHRIFARSYNFWICFLVFFCPTLRSDHKWRTEASAATPPAWMRGENVGAYYANDIRYQFEIRL